MGKHAHCFKRGLEELDKANVGQWILCHVLADRSNPLALDPLIALSASLLYATGTKGS